MADKPPALQGEKSMPYVVLNQIVRLKKGGKLRTYHRGDSIKVGRQQALQWLLDGTARDPFKQVKQINYSAALGKYGILILAPEGRVSLKTLGALGKSLEVVYDSNWEGLLPYEYNIIWNTAGTLNENYLNYGLNIVTKSWEMAAGLINLKGTLKTCGSDIDRRDTLKLYGDLRLPVYKTNILWLKATTKTKIFAEIYAKLLLKKVHPGHAFARAWLESQPLLYTMPLI